MEACVRKSRVCRIKSNHAGANKRKIHSRKRRSHRSCGPAPRAGTARVSPRPRQGTADRCSVHAHESAAPLSHGCSDDDGDRGQRAQLLARRQALSDNLTYAKEHSRFACTCVRVHGTSLRANLTAKKQFYHDPRSPWGGKGRRVESRSRGPAVAKAESEHAVRHLPASQRGTPVPHRRAPVSGWGRPCSACCR